MRAACRNQQKKLNSDMEPKTLLFLMLAFFLSACAGAPSRVVTGGEVAAPGGYVDFCMRDPRAPECNRR